LEHIYNDQYQTVVTAYNILSDVRTRSTYDMARQEQSVPESKPYENPRAFRYSTNGGPGGFKFANPEDVFAEFFRGSGEPDSNPFGQPHGEKPDRKQQPAPEATVLEKPLLCTLEELFNGTTKKMKIKRKTYDAAGKPITEDRILQVPIKPGLKAGSKIKFTNVGDQIEGGTQDIHFVIGEVRFISIYILRFILT